MQEKPIASLQALTANINRDPNKTKAFDIKDFALFRKHESEDEAELMPEASAVALELRAEGRLPALILCAWNAILSSATQNAAIPSVRALRSDDDCVWVIAPRWEGPNVRGGLVAVRSGISGPVLMRDIDRSLATYVFQIPSKPLAGWLEGGLLLLAANLEA